MDYVRIFDTTLRDGEQSPGATMTSAEKLEVAKALARLRVDVIEAGFPAASPDDLAAVRTIAEQVGTGDNAPIICALARAAQHDIRQAWEGVKAATRPRIHTFLATSDLHMQHKLRMSEEKLPRATELLRARFILHCDAKECAAFAAASGREPLLASRKSACERCGGSDNARAETEFLEACRRRGARRVVVVGGSPAVREELESKLGGALELRHAVEAYLEDAEALVAPVEGRK